MRSYAPASRTALVRLLHVLAAQHGRARVGAIGVETSVAAAWIVSGLRPEVRFVTVAAKPEDARLASELFADDPNVRVLRGEWRELMPPEAPFDLVFYAPAEQRAESDAERVAGLLAPGATVVVDASAAGAPARDVWLEHGALAAVELPTTPTAVVATRVH